MVRGAKQKFCILKNLQINSQESPQFSIIKYFYLIFTAVSGRLKRNLRF